MIHHLTTYYAPLHAAHGKAFYDDVRSRVPEGLTDDGLAAWFLYLNKTGFNGLYRVNQSGRFNVPMGRYKNPTICDVVNLRACSGALQGAVICHQDFRSALASVKTNDLAYCDPPYVPLTATSNFAAYTADGFDARDQTNLRDWAVHLKQAVDAHVILSNSTAARALYTDPLFEISEVKRGGGINSDTTKRGAVTELLIR